MLLQTIWSWYRAWSALSAISWSCSQWVLHSARDLFIINLMDRIFRRSQVGEDFHSESLLFADNVEVLASSGGPPQLVLEWSVVEWEVAVMRIRT